MKRLISLVLISWMACVAQAEQVADLYSAEVPVEDKTTTTRTAGIEAAFAVVVTKVTGYASAVNQVNTALAPRLLKSYRFVSRPAWIDGEPDQLLLRAEFSRAPLDEYLTQRQLPLWGNNRPTVLVVVADSDGVRHRVINNADDALTRVITTAINERGLPVVWPGRSWKQQQDLPARDVYRLNEEAVAQGTSDFDADALLVGRIEYQRTGQSFTGYLQHSGSRISIEATAVDEFELFSKVSDYVASFFARRYAVSGSSDTTQSMRVTNVTSFRAYQSLLQALNAIAGIESVQVRSVMADQISLDLQLKADWRQVSAYLGLNPNLSAGVEPGSFRWDD